MTILVTGGAGYIGSHAVEHLLNAGQSVVVADNLFRGHREAVHPDAKLYEVDLAETDQLAQIMRTHSVSGVMHFAALTYVGESVDQPIWYYANNTGGTASLLRAMETAGVNRFVFSSTCATYGEPDELPIVETISQHPINPYGQSKLFVEQMLKDKVATDNEFSFIALRYFNVAGCSLGGRIGEDHDPETHLIPIVLQVALGQRERVQVFGTDYPTPDGTCIRDYIHVDDLCAAHLLAMESLKPGEGNFYNLGIGKGYSVREVIESVKRVTGKDIPATEVDRREGDPPELFANADKLRGELGWKPNVPDLDDIVRSAWDWFQAHPNGYAS